MHFPQEHWVRHLPWKQDQVRTHQGLLQVMLGEGVAQPHTASRSAQSRDSTRFLDTESQVRHDSCTPVTERSEQNVSVYV